MAGSVEALERFERQTALPALVLAIASLPLLAAPLIWEFSSTTDSTIFALDWFIWGAFALEYVVRLYLAPMKRAFVRTNLIDLAVVLLPFLRPLRLARSARVLRLLRMGRVLVLAARGVDALRDVLQKRRLNYTLLFAGIATVGAALMVLEFERPGEESNIRSLPDALWWAITTITTVGYGDRFPTTAGGRAIGAMLMVIGIALFGLLAATVSAFFVRKDAVDEMDPQLVEINEKLERIEQLLGADRPAEAENLTGSATKE
ncbi:MAG: ion transporter [Actinomycetota bacterium]